MPRASKLASLKRFAWLSIAAALATIGLKTLAWWITGSVGLLSDAIESLVNLAAASMALSMLAVAERPPDASYAFGRSKAELFSSAVEGLLIFGAAVWIGYGAIERLLDPRELELVGLGLATSAVAAGIDLATARALLVAGREHRSIALEADARHLMTDVWTSAGVIIGVGAGALTGWLWLDPVVALAVAMNILWMGARLVRRSARGLMDASIPGTDLAAIEAVLERYRRRGFSFHALRTREAGRRAFVSMHVLVPGAWSVQEGHDWLERIEADIHAVVPYATVFTHLEPIEDPVSMADQELDRSDESAQRMRAENHPGGTPAPPRPMPSE